jgi:major membrane immunogen (membrane-anchored lipoprotein)
VTAGGTTSGKNFQLDLGGTISGTVYQSNGTTPVTGVQVQVHVQQGTPCGSMQLVAGSQTNSTNGTYTITGVPVGTYYLQTWNNGTNYLNEWWASPNSVLDCSGAQTVTVTAGATTSGKNFQLDLGGAISGTVYQSNGITPITGGVIGVRVMQGDPCGNQNQVGYTNTNSDGTYTVTGLPAGTYYLQTQNNGVNYLNEWWASPNSTLDCNNAQQVTVTAGATTPGKDFQLDLGGTITGTVYQSNGTTPVTGVQVHISVGQGDPCGSIQWVGWSDTNPADGTYTITGVPAGTYYLNSYNMGQSNYVNEWWASPNSVLDCSGAQTVTVTAGGTTSGKNFQLDLGGTISGTVYQSNGTTPITGVQIGVNVQQGGPCGPTQGVAWTQTNSTNGTYTITGVPVGTYYLQTNNNGTN